MSSPGVAATLMPYFGLATGIARIRYIAPSWPISLETLRRTSLRSLLLEHLGCGQDRRDLGRRQLHGHGGRASGTTGAGGGSLGWPRRSPGRHLRLGLVTQQRRIGLGLRHHAGGVKRREGEDRRVVFQRRPLGQDLLLLLDR